MRKIETVFISSIRLDLMHKWLKRIPIYFFISTTLVGFSSQAADSILISEQHGNQFGFEIGVGQTADIPACSNCPPPRRSHRFISLLGVYERPIQHQLVDGARGQLSWRMEAGLATITDGNENEQSYLINLSPLMVQYRTHSPNKSWSQKLLGGIGFGRTNWKDFGGKPLNSASQFLVHIGAGLEFQRATKPYSLDYRLLHVSNGGSGSPNIGINAHVISITIPF
ncbi:MAG: hypothetical protein CL402_02885 [Acidiferrobacteraceae bacterium]|nr:hypothetical protein [Acidiferrobacteraceae bacterium]|tara:strand:- start:47944 stop:48618 length:675 start_codon:yes stop_codon:yes gene_type:complete